MGDFSRDVLTHAHELPAEILKDIFGRLVKTINCCMGIEIFRGPPQSTKADYMAPNTFIGWDMYVEGQPEFRYGAPDGYFMNNIEWAREHITSGDIRIERNILFIDAYNLLRYGSRETILAKKALMLNLQLGVCPLIIFKVWNKEDFCSAFSCVPHRLFYNHFGKILQTNPLGLQIAYDQNDQPRHVWDRTRIAMRQFGRNPIFLVNHLTERQAHVNWENDFSPEDTSHSSAWYEAEDNGGRLTLDRWNVGGYYYTFNDTTPVAECKNWDVVPNQIYIPRI